MSADATAPQLSATLALRLRELDVQLRRDGAFAPDARPLWEQPDVVRLLVAWRAADYGDGREQRQLSQQLPAVKPLSR